MYHFCFLTIWFPSINYLCKFWQWTPSSVSVWLLRTLKNFNSKIMHIYGRKIFKDHSTQRLKQLKVLNVCPCTYNITTSNLNISIAFPSTINKNQFYKMSIMWYIFSSSCFIKYSFIYLKSRTTLKKGETKKREKSSTWWPTPCLFACLPYKLLEGT